jgi:hypothetical protein
LTNTTLDINKNMRQWTWQYCTEFGWFQEPNPVYSTRSEALSHTYWIEMCQRAFGTQIPLPAINKTNDYFGGLEITGDNIVFMTASEDPWQYAGMTKIHNPDTQKDMRAIHITCPDCSHCVDLHSPSKTEQPALTKARTEAQMIIKNWLQEARQEAQMFLQ